MNLIFFPLFFLSSYFSFYIPGSLILSFVYPSLMKGKRFIYSWGVGIAFFLLFAYCFAWIHVDLLLLVILVLIALFVCAKRRAIFLFPSVTDWVSLAFILFGSLSFLALTFFSGYTTSKGLQFIGTINAIDGLLHVANMQNFLLYFPPTHASLVGIPLRGYHYFYDLLASRFILFYHFSPFDLHYRFFPLFLSLFYGGAVYSFTTNITKNKIAIWFTLFFAYFAQSSAPFIHLLISSVSPQSELGLVYPIELITNPALLLSISLMLILFSLLLDLKNFKQALVLGVVLGVISEVKIYGGIIALGAIVLYSAYYIFANKKLSFPHTVLLVVAAFITAITYLPNNGGSGYLWYSPFFVYSVFMQEPPVSVLNWELQRRIFADHHNVIHLTILYVQAFIIFWISALGTRLIFLFGILNVFRKTFWIGKNLLVLFSIMIPIIIATLFVQSISIFDTKQFLWIAAALLAIPAGIVAGNIFTKASILGKIGIFLLLGFGFFQVYIFQMDTSTFPHVKFIVTKKQVQLLEKVANQVPQNSFIAAVIHKELLSGPERDAYEASPVFAAVTGRNTFYEPESAQYDLKNVFDQRQKTLDNLAASFTTCNLKNAKNILHSIHTKFVVIYPNQNCAGGNFVQEKTVSDSMAFYIFK